MMFELREYGFSTAIGIGGDPVIGTTHIDAIEAFEKDPETKVIVMIGEIGGDARSVPPTTSRQRHQAGRRLCGRLHRSRGQDHGPRRRIVSGSSGTAQAKKDALEAAGVKVGKTPSETAALAREILASL